MFTKIRLGFLFGTHLVFSTLYDRLLGYSKNPYVRTLNFQGQAAVGSYFVITISNIRLLGS